MPGARPASTSKTDIDLILTRGDMLHCGSVMQSADPHFGILDRSVHRENDVIQTSPHLDRCGWVGFAFMFS